MRPGCGLKYRVRVGSTTAEHFSYRGGKQSAHWPQSLCPERGRKEGRTSKKGRNKDRKRESTMEIREERKIE